MLSVIIATWNGLRYLPECLAALTPQLPAAAEVIVVDNGSTDGTCAWLRATYPAVQLVALPENIGFAGGTTAGLRVARGDLLLLLNNDAFVEPGFVAALLDVMAERPDVGAAGGVLTFAHRPDVVASAGIRIRRDGVALDMWPGRAVDDLPTTPVTIAGPSGAAALYRRALLEDAGLLEPAFFAYLEDVDLALRALLRGWQSVVVPAARVRHVYSATGGQGSPFKQRLLGRNRLRVIVRCFPAPLLLRCLPAMVMYDVLAAGYAVVRQQPAMIAGRMAALRELPRLLRERHEIQKRRTAPITDLEHWLDPWVLPWTTMQEQQHLEAILASRTAL
ncbi:MAG TPA: glycosyltransferase family 2 protein [Roseiflexaceae bacterium]|jgi:GT2 family glycosyltransferase|nr:glycosyltransferase family 2 protein [Roseiflexaceae bacterium]